MDANMVAYIRLIISFKKILFDIRTGVELESCDSEYSVRLALLIKSRGSGLTRCLQKPVNS